MMTWENTGLVIRHTSITRTTLAAMRGPRPILEANGADGENGGTTEERSERRRNGVIALRILVDPHRRDEPAAFWRCSGGL